MADPISDAVYAALQQMQAHPELRQAMQGVAGNTIPGQRITGGIAPNLGGGPQIYPVPGQKAWQVAREQPQATIGTHDGGVFPPRGDLFKDPVFDESDSTTTGGDSSLDSIIRGLSGAGSTTGTSDPADRGWLGQFLPEGVSNFVADVGVGMGQADPTKPASTAFGEAFTGAQASNIARLERKRADQKDLTNEARIEEDRAIAAADREHDLEREKLGDVRYGAEQRRQQLADDRAAAMADISLEAADLNLTISQQAFQDSEDIQEHFGASGDMVKSIMRDASDAARRKVDSSETLLNFDEEFDKMFRGMLTSYKKIHAEGSGVEPAELILGSPDNPLTIPPEIEDVPAYLEAKAKELGLSKLTYFGEKEEAGKKFTWPPRP